MRDRWFSVRSSQFSVQVPGNECPVGKEKQFHAEGAEARRGGSGDFSEKCTSLSASPRPPREILFFRSGTGHSFPGRCTQFSVLGFEPSRTVAESGLFARARFVAVVVLPFSALGATPPEPRTENRNSSHHLQVLEM